MPSSVIQAFAYDAECRRLTVRFVSGRVYAYDDVPADIAAALAGAPSQGAYFNADIRDRFAAHRVKRSMP